MFPLIKARKEGKMAGIHFELITDPSNVREIKLDQTSKKVDAGRLLHGNFMPQNNSHVQITEN